MPRVPDAPCSGGCGRLIWRGKGCLPPGQSMCQPCRRERKTQVQVQLTCTVCAAKFAYKASGGFRPKTCSPLCAERLRARRREASHPCPDCGRPAIGVPRRRCDACREVRLKATWRRKADRRRQATIARRPTRTCLRCGSTIANSARSTYCSASCAAAPTRIALVGCVECDAPVEGGRWRYCSQACAYAAQRRRDLARTGRTPEQVDSCAACGNPKSSSPGRPSKARRCSACRLAATRRSRQACRRRRRARKRRAKHEPYTLAEIASRDRHRCGICRKRVDMTLVVPDFGAPTIDHIVPFALDGDDVKANVRLAHFICNSRRGAGNPTEAVQLLLVG